MEDEAALGPAVDNPRQVLPGETIRVSRNQDTLKPPKLREANKHDGGGGHSTPPPSLRSLEAVNESNVSRLLHTLEK